MRSDSVTEYLVWPRKAIGHIPGGLGHANVLASMIFAGMSGSAMADAGGLGAIEIKAMNEAGYDKGFSVAITAASSGIGPIIPPSINLVIWGFLASTGTVELFMAGVLPGILMGLCLMVYIYIAVTKFHVKAPITPKAPFKDFLHALWRGLPALGAPAILLAASAQASSHLLRPVLWPVHISFCLVSATGG